jgi:predicted outer membrane repeat protein
MKTTVRFLMFWVVLAFTLSAWGVTSVHAAGIVTTCDETSLKAALTGGGTVTFACSGTITLTSAITIASHTTLDGAGQTVIISGNGVARVFYVNSGITFDLNNLTVTNGKCVSCDGGGLYNKSGTVNVTNSTFSGNSVTTYGGDGGGIFNDGGALTVTNSAFSGNSAGGYGGGISSKSGTLTVTNSTFSGNSAGMHGGGVYNSSNSSTGDICAATPAVTIINSTFSGNTAVTSGGGIRNDSGVMAISYSTVTANTGGVASYNDNFTCTRVGGSIIAGNTGSDVTAGDTIHRFFSLGHNLIGAAGANVDFSQEFNQPGDQTAVAAPKLGALGHYGGTTQTIPPLSTSPAIDAGDDAVCAASPVNGFDQRGVARPKGAHCDIGAFEFDGPTNLLLSATSLPENKPAGTVVGNLTATDPGDTFTFALKSGVTGCAATHNVSFQIVGAALKTKSIFDYETRNSYAVCIRVTDSSGLTFDKSFIIKVTNMVDEVAKNGGFELYAGTSKIPTYWAQVGFGTLDGKNTAFKTGKYAVKIANTVAKVKTLTQTLSVPTGASGQKFTFSYWVKGTTVPSAGNCQGQVLFYNGSTLNKTVTLICGKTGTFAYTLRTFSFTTSTLFTKVVIKFTYSKSNSAVWFDGVSLKK